MGNTIRVGIADMNVCRYPDKITTIGLGSCVGIVLYDSAQKVGGMVHIMLPDSTQITQNQNKLKFADTGIDALISLMERNGVRRSAMLAKIAGGAKMFSFGNASDLGSIGDKNIEAVKRKLKSVGIRIVSEDVGLNYGRTIVFDPDSKDLAVIKAGNQQKVI